MQPNFKTLNRRRKKRRKSLYQSLVVELIYPFIIMLTATLIPMAIAIKFTINDAHFSIIKFIAIIIPILLVTVSAGVLIVDKLEHNDYYL